MTSPAVEVRELRKSYGRHRALAGIDLRLDPGTVLGLIGPNGAGKTTTLRILMDILRPSDGIVRVLGEDPRRGGAALRRRIGYLPGDLRLDGRSSGRRMLSFYRRVSGPVAQGRQEELAERLDLDLSRSAGALSKGNRQKLGIVQAFAHRPELLILDEPTSGLDPLVQTVFLDLVREARREGAAVLLSSHVLSEIQHVADDVVVLAAGRIIATGDVATLRRGAGRRIRARFVATDVAPVRQRLAPLPLRDASVSAEADGVLLEALYDGDLDRLVKTIATLTTAELEIQEPDLEDAVLRLYADPRAPRPGDAPLDLATMLRPAAGAAPAEAGLEARGGGRGRMIPVLLRELAGTWRSLVLWALAIVAILGLYLPLYPSLVGGDMQQLLDALPPDLVATLGYDDITSGAGYAQATFFGLMGFFLVTAASIAWASQAVAGHEQSGRLELDLAHGIGRAEYVAAQALALLIRVLALVGVGVVVILALNDSAELGLEPGPVLVAGAALAGLALFCGVWALLAGAAVGGRALSAGVGALVAVAGYAMNAVAAQNPDLEWLGNLSPYTWAFGDAPLKGGVTAADLWPLWAVVVALPLVAALSLTRRDLRA